MILKHIPEQSGLLKISRPVFYAQGFRYRNLYMVYIPSIPDRLKDGVGKSEHQDVLDGLFTQVVVDTVYLMHLSWSNTNLNMLTLLNNEKIAPNGHTVRQNGLLLNTIHPRKSAKSDALKPN